MSNLIKVIFMFVLSNVVTAAPLTLDSIKGCYEVDEFNGKKVKPTTPDIWLCNNPVTCSYVYLKDTDDTDLNGNKLEAFMFQVVSRIYNIDVLKKTFTFDTDVQKLFYTLGKITYSSDEELKWAFDGDFLGAGKTKLNTRQSLNVKKNANDYSFSVQVSFPDYGVLYESDYKMEKVPCP